MPCANHRKIPRRAGRRLPVAVRPPARHTAIPLDAAGVREPGAHRIEQRPRRHVRLPVMVVAPAFHLSVVPQPAGVFPAGRYCGKPARRRVRLPVFVAAPTGRRAIVPQSAGMRPPGVNGGKAARRRRRLAGCIIAPAFNLAAVGADAAGVFVARADGGKGAVRRVGLPLISIPRWRPSIGRCRRVVDSRCACLQRRWRRQCPAPAAGARPARWPGCSCSIATSGALRRASPGASWR